MIKIKKYFVFCLTAILIIPLFVSAHRSGCHRWHSCPSDSGSYVCGDSGHPCLYSSPSSSKTINSTTSSSNNIKKNATSYETSNILNATATLPIVKIQNASTTTEKLTEDQIIEKINSITALIAKLQSQLKLLKN